MLYATNTTQVLAEGGRGTRQDKFFSATVRNDSFQTLLASILSLPCIQFLQYVLQAIKTGGGKGLSFIPRPY